MKKAIVAMAMSVALASTGVMAAQSGTISGTAKDEVKKDYSQYKVYARDASGAQVGESPLDTDGKFSLANLNPATYMVELVRMQGNNTKVVCTEGPFDLTQQANRDNVTIDCNKVPAAWWLLGAAAAAGVTAGIVATASPSR